MSLRPHARNSSPAATSPQPVVQTAATYITHFPVLATTRLALDLHLHAGAPNLQTLTDIVGRDPGAVLRVMRLIAQEVRNPADRPERLEDSLATLPTRHLAESLHTPPSTSQEQALAISFAQHGFLIASLARLSACSLGLCPDRAFLIGLLHAIGTLPSELGRTSAPSTLGEEAEVASAIARAHNLSPALCDLLVTVHLQDARSVWVAVVHAAHELAAARTHTVGP